MTLNFIPKIQYGNTTLTGTTSSGVPEVTGLSSTIDLSEGMIAVGTGIPVGATILSIDSETEVTLSANATASGSVSIEFYNEIVFQYPWKDDDGEDVSPMIKKETSRSGINQVQLLYTEYTREVTFSFLSLTLFNQVKSFFENHAGQGKEFKYFEHKTESEYFTYESSDNKFKPNRIVSKGTDFLYEVKLKFRRAVA